MADRHKPEDMPISLRPPADLKVWLSEESERRGISRSALIIEAIREKRERGPRGNLGSTVGVAL